MVKDRIWVFTPTLQGILPFIELSKKIASTGYKTSLVIPSKLSSSVASYLRRHPRVAVRELSVPSPPALHPGFENTLEQHTDQSEMVEALKKHLSKQPSFVVIDVQMLCPLDIFKKSHIPTIAFFTSGACAAATEHAKWKTHSEDIQQPPWLQVASHSVGLMFNTCDPLEGPFIKYISDQIGKPVWSVGPFSRDLRWNVKGAGKVELGQGLVSKLEGLFCCGSGVKVGLEVGEFIDNNRRPRRCTDNELPQWLNSKPKGSVIYVSCGWETGLTVEESQELARALEKSARPFIRHGQGSGIPKPTGGGQPSLSEEDYPLGLDGTSANWDIERPLIPGEPSAEKDFFLGLDWGANLDIVEPFILTHPSIGGILSNCQWNSTVEALVQGLPILAWPKNGDQFYNAELVVNHLKMGYLVAEDISGMVQEEDIAQGIEKLMGDVEMSARATGLRAEFENGFPKSSMAALNASVESAILL